MPRPRLERPDYTLVTLKGRRSRYVQWTENGRTQRVSTGTADEGAAKRFLADFEDRRSNGGEVIQTVGTLIDAHRAKLEARGAHRSGLNFLTHAKTEFGDLLPKHLTPERVGDYIKRMIADDRATMARRVLEMLRAATGVEMALPPAPEAREEFLTGEQVRRLLAACKTQHLRLFILIAVETGARHGAILELTWDRVDLARGVLDFRKPGRHKTKKRRGEAAAISTDLRAELEAAKKIARTGHVIEWSGASVKSVGFGFATAARAAGLPCTPHILKHTAISLMAEHGHSVDQICDQTRTSPEVVRRIYRKVRPEISRPLAESASGAVRGISLQCDEKLVDKPQYSASVPIQKRRRRKGLTTQEGVAH